MRYIGYNCTPFDIALRVNIHYKGRKLDFFDTQVLCRFSLREIYAVAEQD